MQIDTEVGMELHVTTYQGRTITTVLRLSGKLDATSYLDVINKANQVFSEGVRQMVLDLSALTYISSAGLMALHYVAMLLRGEAPPDPETGWSALHTAAEQVPEAIQPNLKLLSPQPQVLKTLERVQFTRFLEIYPTLDDALSAFSPLTDRRDQSQRQMRYLQALNPDLPTRSPGKHEPE